VEATLEAEQGPKRDPFFNRVDRILLKSSISKGTRFFSGTRLGAGMIELNAQAAPLVDATSASFLGQWNRLVSSTNWEKGRIIYEWREALVEAGVPAAEYSDEEWSRRAGGVTGQHVGRLRRVHERFAATREQFAGLYWSHFQAALDWGDAEMWLEGAGQNDWSVAEMRRRRAETLGQLEAEAAEFATAESDGEIALEERAEPAEVSSHAESSHGSDETSDADHSSRKKTHASTDDAEEGVGDESHMEMATEELRRPFAHLADLPDDLSEAFEAFKLGIVRHKLAGWTDVARDDVLAALDALRELTLAPAE
jgi:hypothetical protein